MYEKKKIYIRNKNDLIKIDGKSNSKLDGNYCLKTVRRTIIKDFFVKHIFYEKYQNTLLSVHVSVIAEIRYWIKKIEKIIRQKIQTT